MLTPEMLIAAYCQGIFPMADERGVITWYDPHPRAILPLDAFHVPRRLARTVRKGVFTIRTDTAFTDVMRACAAPAPGRESTWISEEMIEAYTALHRMGRAHSVEAWREGRLVGGLYGVAIRGLFAGESMFSRERDASKVALVHLVERLRRGGYVLLDSQFLGSPHLLLVGLIEFPRRTYKQLLARALQVEATWDVPA